jgi:hypothetical protein
MMPNENCLEGMKCPKCGHEDSFGIACDIMMLVTDEGVTDQLGDNEWNEDSYCECRKCLKSGTVKDFQMLVPPTTLKTLVNRLRALKDEHEQLEDDRGRDGFEDGDGERKHGLCDEEIDKRENEIYEECFEIAQDIVDLNLGA